MRMRSHRRREVFARVPAGVMLAITAVAVVAGALVWRSRSRDVDTRVAATRPASTAVVAATTQSVAATRPVPVARTWLDIVHAAYPSYAATQPLDLPADLDESARVVIADPVYLCGRQDLWVTRPDADPTDDVLKRADQDQVHVLRDRVLFVHWTYDDKGKPYPTLVVPGNGGGLQLVSLGERRALSLPSQGLDWSRAFDYFNDDVVVPTTAGVNVLHLEGKQSRPPDILLFDDVNPPPAGGNHARRSPVQIARGPRGLIAWVPWDNGRRGSRGAARYVNGQWSRLHAGTGWPEKIVHLILLLDGSVAQLFIGDDDKFNVAIAPLDAFGASVVAGAGNDAPAIDEKQVNAFIAQLSDPDPAKREEAYAQLTRYGPGIFPLLEKVQPQQPPEARDRIDELLKARVTPTLGGVTLLPGVVTTAARLRDGGVVLYADAGASVSHGGDDPVTIAPAWIGIRPSWPVRLLPEAMVHELQPGRQRIEATFDEWVVTDDVQGPRRFVGNHFEVLLRKADRARFTEWVGIDRRGRWIFKQPPRRDAQAHPTTSRATTSTTTASAPPPDATLLIDPTIPDPTPRLPVWNWPTDGGKVGWTVDNWPAVRKGGTWVLGESGWRPLDDKQEKFITDLPDAPPEPADAGASATTMPHAAATAADQPSKTTTAPSSTPTTLASTTSPSTSPTTQSITLDGAYPIFTDKDGTRYYDGQKSLKIRTRDGRVTTWPLPPNAVGAADAWLVHAGSTGSPQGGDRFFLFNQAGRMLRLVPTPGASEPFKVDAVFTKNIPNTDSPQRVWLDPAGRIIIAHGSNLTICFPTGRVPSEIAKMMPQEKADDE
jgi:hypothetical protein